MCFGVGGTYVFSATSGYLFVKITKMNKILDDKVVEQ